MSKEFDVWGYGNSQIKIVPATARFVDDRDAPAGFDRHLLRVEAASAREARQKYYEAKRAIVKTKINLSDFVDGGRKVVLDALDKYVRETVDHFEARGWVDAELPKLFLSVDAHLESVAKRIYNGEEPGSAVVSIDMDS